jgi:coatomer protein complex subunit epsilon
VVGVFTDFLQGGEKYQQAFYVFEELAQSAATSSTQSLVSQAVAEIHLGRLEEAEAALQQALVKEPQNAHIIGNLIVLNTVAGKDTQDFTRFVS